MRAATGTPGTRAGAASLVTVVIDGCQGCGACLLTCPEHAIRPAGSALTVRADRCSGCGECVEVCPVDAVTLVEPGPVPGGGDGPGTDGGGWR
jgi:Pyruvate/2-oxoacid:ferredoxin oxidoreductase delta subunit